jgi:N-acetylmuramoyl-L-alanine amidase
VKTKCPAILTENLFYDNKDEVKFLQSEEGREAIAQIHVNAILKIENPDG